MTTSAGSRLSWFKSSSTLAPDAPTNGMHILFSSWPGFRPTTRTLAVSGNPTGGTGNSASALAEHFSQWSIAFMYLWSKVVLSLVNISGIFSFVYCVDYVCFVFQYSLVRYHDYLYSKLLGCIG